MEIFEKSPCRNKKSRFKWFKATFCDQMLFIAVCELYSRVYTIKPQRWILDPWLWFKMLK